MMAVNPANIPDILKVCQASSGEYFTCGRPNADISCQDICGRGFDMDCSLRVNQDFHHTFLHHTIRFQQNIPEGRIRGNGYRDSVRYWGTSGKCLDLPPICQKLVPSFTRTLRK